MKKTNLFRKSLAALLLLMSLVAGCVNKQELGGGSQLGGYTFIRNELGNLRFELVQRPGEPVIHPSLNFRIRRGDEIAFKWDKFYGFWQKDGAMCTFNQQSESTEDCRVCQDCNPIMADRNVVPCKFILYSDQDESFAIEEYKDFIVQDNNRKRVQVGSSQNWICPEGMKHAPEFDATYQLPIDTVVQGEAKVFVYSGSPRSVQYQLSKRILDGKTYWAWTVGGDFKWTENYSPDLRITNVRIFEAACGLDTISNECTVPLEATLVKPSRILFIPSLGSSLESTNEKSFRCYSAASQNDETKAFINLAKCLAEYQSTEPTEKFVTPTYIHDIEDDKVTWLVEFNTDEGSTNAANISSLIIQFDIEGF